MIPTASPTLGSVTVPSTPAAVTPTLTRWRGHEFSGVAGFTYNFKNPDTQVQSGADFHFDWGASMFLSKQVFVGLVGYAYQQISNDIGAGIPEPKGIWRTRCGKPAIGVEYWLTFAISEKPPETTVTPTRHMVTK
jgi:hypothetical protein